MKKDFNEQAATQRLKRFAFSSSEASDPSE
jgi:hypothetical protein